MARIDCMMCLASGLPHLGTSKNEGKVTHGITSVHDGGIPLCGISRDILSPTSQLFIRTGTIVAKIAGPDALVMEAWVKGIAVDFSAKLDWKPFGGWCLVLALGNSYELERARDACIDRMPYLRELHKAFSSKFEGKVPRLIWKDV